MESVELTFAQQSAAFLWSFLPGVCLGVLYGAVRFMRVCFSAGRAAVIFSDIAFMLVWALTVFYFSLAFMRGYVRAHVIIGTVLGFFAYRLSIGALICRLYAPVLKAARKIFHKIFAKGKIFAKYLLKIAYKLLYNICINRRRRSDCIKQPVKNVKRELYETEKAKNKENGSQSRPS